jgi:hypothetical protein
LLTSDLRNWISHNRHRQHASQEILIAAKRIDAVIAAIWIAASG